MIFKQIKSKSNIGLQGGAGLLPFMQNPNGVAGKSPIWPFLVKTLICIVMNFTSFGCICFFSNKNSYY